MGKMMERDTEYRAWLSEILDRFHRSQIKVSVAVNCHVLEFYWTLGRDITDMQVENRYGSDFYETLSRDLRDAMPQAKGFSSQNLRYMKRFYELFLPVSDNLPQFAEDLTARQGLEIVSAPCGAIS